MGGFDHDRLTVYQRALEFVTVSYAIRRSFPPGCQNLADQLERSTVSIVLNIAEGAGEFAKREKARFYRIARRSATECAGILDNRDWDLDVPWPGSGSVGESYSLRPRPRAARVPNASSVAATKARAGAVITGATCCMVSHSTT